MIDSLTLLILDNSTKSIIAIKHLRSSISRYGEIGIRAGFKYQFRKEYEFDSHYRDHTNNQVTSDGQIRLRRRCMVELAIYHTNRKWCVRVRLRGERLFDLGESLAQLVAQRFKGEIIWNYQHMLKEL